MQDLIIIGSGFSSFVFKKLLKNNYKIISPKLINQTLKGYYQNKNIKVGKFLGAKSLSITQHSFNYGKNIKFHDYLINGGTSKTWGGVVNKALVREKKIFDVLGFKLVKLSLNNTFSYSNNSDYYQLQDNDGKIASFESSDENLLNGFLKQIVINNNSIKLTYYCLNENRYKEILCKKLILAMGLVQILDLLFTSNLVNDNAKLTVDEYDHKLKFSFIKSITCQEDTIKYNLVGAIKHFIGYQKKLPTLLKLFSFLPFFIEQKYLKKKKRIYISKKNKSLCIYDKIKFGNSIHYCNLLINNKNINSFFEDISDNKVNVISMPAVEQGKPGPICNDIINHIDKIIKKI